MKQKKMIKWIDITFWTIIIFNCIIEISKALKTGDINWDISMLNMLGIKEYLIMVILAFVIFLFFTVISLLKMYYLTIIYIGIRIAYRKYNKEKLDEIDFKNDSYYREIISNYSPGVLSYIDDFKLDEKDIVATLMSLELKQKIKIEDTINIIDESEENLEENEKYIFDSIKEHNLKDINFITFENKVINDCLNNNLLEEKKYIKKQIIRKILTCMCVYTLVIIGFLCFPFIFNKIQMDNDIIILLLFAVMLIIFFTMAIFPLSVGIYIKSYYFMNKLNPYVRNKKAKEINLKLEGLKKYIKEYTLLDRKKNKDIIMWEDYLIYSVILGQNTKIVDEIMKKIEKT